MRDIDLFGNPLECRKALTLFADERKNINDTWHYLGLLIVPSYKLQRAIDCLVSHKKQFNLLDSEIKFSGMNAKGNGAKFKCAMRWINELVNDSAGLFYFSILGIDLSKLDFSYFGEGKDMGGEKYANIYNRFFRTNVIGAIKFFFPNTPVLISGVYHDTEGNLENHDYFSWHLSSKTQDDPQIRVKNEIQFVHSHPKKEVVHKEYSTFIQLVDLIVGSVSYCFDYISTKNKGQRCLAQTILPAVEEIVSGGWRRSPKSAVSFFPSQRISMVDSIENRGLCYCSRPVKLNYGHDKVDQGGLFDGLDEVY